MKPIRLAVMAAPLLLSLGACTSQSVVQGTDNDPYWRPLGLQYDPLVHGPFLIGAARPVVPEPLCERAGAMRSQDVRGVWKICQDLNVTAPGGSPGPYDPETFAPTMTGRPLTASRSLAPFESTDSARAPAVVDSRPTTRAYAPRARSAWN